MKTVALVSLDDVETVANAAVAGEQHRGARGDRFIERSDRDRRELDVVHEDLPTVRDHEELGRLAIAPAKTIRALQRQRAGDGLEQALIRGPELPAESRPSGS